MKSLVSIILGVTPEIVSTTRSFVHQSAKQQRQKHSWSSTMKTKSGSLPFRLAPRAAGFVLATVLPFAVSTASAFELNLGAVKGSLDTTVSFGSGWRLESPEDATWTSYNTLGDPTSAVNVNRRTFIHKNDGNANYDNNSRPIMNVFKITSDLELKYNDFGAFVRGTAFYDQVIMDNEVNPAAPNLFPNAASCNPQTAATPANCGFPQEMIDHSGKNLRFLDAYVYGNFDVGGMPLNVRLGDQVVNWGEALFLQDGINNANPVSLSKLRLPGAEVKEALLPLPMLYASLGLTDSLTAEAFYLFDWDYSEADDAGTFYSTDDAFAGLGSNRIVVDLQGGALAAAAQGYNVSVGNQASTIVTVDRMADKPTDGKGQYGVAFRYSLNETELGFYFMNYHSHKPVAQAFSGPNVSPGNAISAMAFLDNTQYQVVYPEDIQMYGLSFSTTAGSFSFSGELAYRPNDIILAELGDNLLAYNTMAAVCYYTGACTAATGANYGGVLGQIAQGGKIQDWAELETYNLDLVSIYNFGPALGSDGMTGVLEFGASYVPKGEDKRYASSASLLNIPLTDVPVGIQPLVCSGPKFEAASCISEGPSNDYLDKLSMGYRLVLTTTYNDVFAGVTLNPVIRFAHDFKGNSHRTGNFLENRKSATVGVNAIYNQALEVSAAYNAFWGAELSNLLRDRDNVTLAIKYSF